MHIISDVQQEIVAMVRAEIKAGPDCIFVCGGLGPTPDDRTLAALAVALDRPLRLDAIAAAHIQLRLDWLHGIGRIKSPEMREANRRMAEIPEGATVLNNSMGMAPGLAMRIDGELGPAAPGVAGARHLFVLPGVPRELKTIVDEEIVPRFLSAGSIHVTEEVHFSMAVEAEFWDLLNRVEREHPGVAVGSYPQPDRGHLIIRLSGPDPAKVAAAAELVRASAPAHAYSEETGQAG